MSLVFGPAGVPLSSKERSTIGGIEEVARLGLSAMELEFVRGVRMSEAMAQSVNSISKKLNVQLTVHAPYFINLNSKEKDKYEASIKRILDSARIGYIAGASSCTFHPAYYGNDDPKTVYTRVKDALKRILEQLDKENIKISIRPETTGKPSQFGTLEEILQLSTDLPGIKPCVDFAHIYARNTGKYNTEEEFAKILGMIKSQLGDDALKDMHIHLSGIVYTEKGEKNHTPLSESDFNWQGVLRVLKDFNTGGIVISESPILEKDALLMQKFYNEL